MSGVLLLVLLTVHMVAQHFVVSGGPRTYADVVAWIRNSAWPWPPSCTACGCWT